MSPQPVAVTNAAASVLRSLAPETLASVAAFLSERFEAYAQTNEPASLEGLEGEFWVVRPTDRDPAISAAVPTLVIGRNPENDDDGYVVVSAIPSPTIEEALEANSFRLGASALNSMRAV